MGTILDKYFVRDRNGYYLDKTSGKYKLKGVNCSYDRTRNQKAVTQATLQPVSLSKVYSYINEFLELIREDNGYSEKNCSVDMIKLDDKEHVIIDNGIIIREKKWIPAEGHWEGKRFIYDLYDKKYDVIKEKFALERVSDLLWFKFTNKGHLAVVAGSCDISFDDKLSCGLLVKEIGEVFDSSFVIVFPLTQQMLRTRLEPNSYYRKYTSEEIELAVGNYLIDKGVPIIDFYSHMGKYAE